MSNLTVITVAYGAGDLLNLMIRSVKKTSSPRILICDTLGNLKTKEAEVIQYKPSLLGGSNAHGESLNYLIKQVKTSHTAIIESDVVVFDGWNKIDNCDALLARKDKGLYHVCFAILKTDLIRGVDFRAGKNKAGRINNKSYGAKYDVGWQLGKVKLNVKPVDFVDCKTDKAVFFKHFQGDEFHLDGKCIAAHFGRGSNIGGKAIRKNFKSHSEQLKEWKQICEKLISNKQ